MVYLCCNHIIKISFAKQTATKEITDFWIFNYVIMCEKYFWTSCLLWVTNGFWKPQLGNVGTLFFISIKRTSFKKTFHLECTACRYKLFLWLPPGRLRRAWCWIIAFICRNFPLVILFADYVQQLTKITGTRLSFKKHKFKKYEAQNAEILRNIARLTLTNITGKITFFIAVMF